MFTPPSNTNNGGPSFPPASVSSHPRRRGGGLPKRSSLNNTFSFPSTPPPGQPLAHSPHASPYGSRLLPDAGDSSFQFLPHVTRDRMAEEAQHGMMSVSPRSRPSRRHHRDLRERETPARSRLGDESFTSAASPAPGMKKRHSREDDDEDDEEEKSWAMVDAMRLWRQDALIQHLYETAAFWGDKILSWTGDANDAFWLAHTHFLCGYYLRAERLLLHPLPPARRPLAPRGDGMDIDQLGKGKGREKLSSSELNGEKPRGRLADTSLACRYLAAQCLVEREQYEEALQLLGTSNPFGNQPTASSSSSAGTHEDCIKLNSSMCHLRGLLHLRLSSVQDAKDSFIEALTIDVKNYEAFRELVEGEMMQAQEEWEFVNKLAYSSQLTDEQAMFVKLMYVSRLKKNGKAREIARAREDLSDRYGLSANCDVLLGLAEEFYAAYKWEACYAITSKILDRVPAHPGALTIHLSCMHHIPRLHSSLFLLAHELVQQDPAAATTWYAVGLWYFSGKRWAEARPYFSKANLIDQRYAPAWIAYSHSLAYEGEHDAAITAFSTCAKLFRGSHLPYLFIGKEHLQLANVDLAKEWLLVAAGICDGDPLLKNELGVVAFNSGDYTSAIEYFRGAVQAAHEMEGSPSVWASTYCNLGHAYRLRGEFDLAKSSYTKSLSLDPTSHTALSSLGWIAIHLDDIRAAIRILHTALSLSPQDPMATVLLEIALKEQVERFGPRTIAGLPGALVGEGFDPFNVPKGNPAFGPLPAESSSDPNDFLAANSAGTTPLLGFDRELRASPGKDNIGRSGGGPVRERSISRREGIARDGLAQTAQSGRAGRAGRGRISEASIELEDEIHEDENDENDENENGMEMDGGEGSTMDLEDD